MCRILGGLNIFMNSTFKETLVFRDFFIKGSQESDYFDRGVDILAGKGIRGLFRADLGLFLGGVEKFPKAHIWGTRFLAKFGFFPESPLLRPKKQEIAGDSW